MKHTPGPWEVLPNSSTVFGVNDKERYEGKRVAVAECGNEIVAAGGLKFGEERDANARLISKAPEMYEAMKAARDAADDRELHEAFDRMSAILDELDKT